MRISKTLHDNKQPLTVTRAEDLCLTCPFQPNAYKAVGHEERLGIVIRATDEIHENFAALEDPSRSLLEADGVDKVDGLWCASAREDDFGENIKGQK